MKRAFFLLLMMISVNASGQVTSVTADPSLGITSVRDVVTNTSLDANTLYTNQLVNMRLPIFNFSQVSSLPQGSCKVQIGLGTNMIIDPLFNLSSAPLAAYFNWTTTTGGSGQVLIIGTLVNPLPSLFAGTAIFRLKCSVAGTSAITSQWLITNDNDNYNLEDNNISNSASSLTYTVSIAVPLPVTFTKVNALKSACDINVKWSIENQVNVDRYEVETSKDGITYTKVAAVAAQNIADYSTSFTLTDQIKGPSIYVRIKVVDKDGSYRYSKTLAVAGTCEQKVLMVRGYPNPVFKQSFINIVAKQGAFNGRYQLKLLDNAGKLYSIKEMTLDNVKSFRFDFDRLLGAGKYMIIIKNTDGSESAVLEFQNL